MSDIVGTEGSDLRIGGDSDDTISGLGGNDDLEGRGGNDTIDGGADNDILLGEAGNDTLIGGSGSDVLTGGTGTDVLTGGTDADFFRDTAAGLNGDRITDLSIGDHIVITDLTFATSNLQLTPTGISFTGGSLTIDNLGPGRLIIHDIQGGGLDIRLTHDARNDFNGDGISDILWRNDSGQVTDWLGQTNGGFASNADNLSGRPGLDWSVAGTGDFNGDGRVDILWRNVDGQVTDWLGQANGSFVTNFENLSGRPGLDWSIVGTGDFNGDGKDDLLWRNNDGTITDWLGLGNGSFASNTANLDGHPGSDWHVAGTGDFNGDGRTDILWRSDSGQVTDWLGTPTGGFITNFANLDGHPGLDWHVAGTGDFDGDGRDDILWRNDDGHVTDWLGQANGGFVTNFGNVNANPGTNWQVVQVGDFNGDGRDDILWRSDTGELTDWLGTSNGSFASNSANLDAHPGTDWHTQPPATML
jgi:hypothetical protein